MRFLSTSIILLISIFTSISINAQDVAHRTCATQDVITQYLLDNYSVEELKGSTPYSATGKMAEGDTDYSVLVVNTDTVYTI